MNIEDRFDAGFAGNYDRGIRAAVPGYEAMHGMSHALLRRGIGERAHILVAGSGTGTEILGLGASEPGWSFTGVDPSGDMSAVARARIAEAGLTDRTNLRPGYVSGLPPDRAFDGATAILVMHFLPNDEKPDFLRSITSRLRPGAPVVLVDLYGDPGSGRFARSIAAWKIHQRANGTEERDVEGMFREMASVVHFVPESRIMALMHKAGLTQVERFYTAMLFGGWTASKR